MKIVREYEVLFRFNRSETSLEVDSISGQAKMLTEFLSEPDAGGRYTVESAKEGDALSLDSEQGQVMLERIVGTVNTALAASVADLEKQIGALEDSNSALEQENFQLRQQLAESTIEAEIVVPPTE